MDAGPRDDRRTDYLILLPDTPTTYASAGVTVLMLDERAVVSKGERVWLPFCDYRAGRPQELVEGSVVEATSSWIRVRLDKRIGLTCESGSPIVSQATGLVIGTLSGGADGGDHTSLWLAPAHAIREAMANAEASNTFPPLLEGVGK